MSADDDLSYLREFEHITLARVLLAQAASERTGHFMGEAMGLLDRLLDAAHAGKRTGSVIEILIVQALALHTQGDMPAALAPLARALALAEPEGYVRVFVDEGPAMAQLLRHAAAHGVMADYAGRLLATFEATPQVRASEVPNPAGHTAPHGPRCTTPHETANPRELDVLRLFQTELSGRRLRRRLLAIALSTLRTHTKGIYSKLNVSNRRAAVNRAVELGLM